MAGLIVAEDLYHLLGVSRDASSDDIRNAYRTLAKKHHPDLNPGDKAAEETFKKVQAANAILSDPEKRRQYDRGEIDAQGNEIQRDYYREYASAGGEHPYRSSAGHDDISDIFSDLFRARGQSGEDVNIRVRGSDIRYTMEVSFLEAVNGTRKRVTMPDGKTLDIAIPKGLHEGQVLRLRDQGMPGLGGSGPGDAYVEIHVAPHPDFHRRGNDIRVDLPIALHEAVLGAKVRVPTIGKAVSMTVPANSNNGDTLRLKGRGVPAAGERPAGDQIVTLRVQLPEKSDDELKSFLAEWAKTHAYDPRTEAKG